MSHRTIQVAGIEVKLDDACRIAGKIREGQEFESNTLVAFADAVRPGSTVVDVGCYSGLFSIIACKLRARAIGFEPMEENRVQIEKNKRLNAVDFPVMNFAVSDKDGVALLGYNDRVKLTAGASLDRKSNPRRRVETTRLDSMPLEDVSVLKIDVEGHEIGVLTGARNLIELQKPLIIAEANDDVHRRAIIDFAKDVGYRLLQVLDTRNLVLRHEKS